VGMDRETGKSVQREKFTRELVLVAPDLDKKMRIEVNVLDYATKGVLSMECEDGR